MNKESKAIAKYAIQLAEHAFRTLTESVQILLSILEEAEESSNDELSEASKGEQVDKSYREQTLDELLDSFSGGEVVKDLPFGFKKGQAETIPAGTFHKEQEGLNLMVDFSKGNPLYNKPQDEGLPPGGFTGGEVVRDLPFGFKRGQAETIPAGTFHNKPQDEKLPPGGFTGGEAVDELPKK